MKQDVFKTRHHRREAVRAAPSVWKKRQHLRQFIKNRNKLFGSVLNRVGNLMKTVDFVTLREVKNICLGVETASKSCLTEKIRR